jgi:hypothetical protein
MQQNTLNQMPLGLSRSREFYRLCHFIPPIPKHQIGAIGEANNKSLRLVMGNSFFKFTK